MILSSLEKSVMNGGKRMIGREIGKRRMEGMECERESERERIHTYKDNLMKKN